MKFLLLLLAIALPLAYVFGAEDYETLSRIGQVSRAPAFAPAQFVEVIERSSKRNVRFRVRFSYTVDGQKFTVLTSQTDRQGAESYLLNAKSAQVAYDARDPSVGILKQYYDAHRPGNTLFKSMFVVALLALALALPFAVSAAWKLGWFKRKTN